MHDRSARGWRRRPSTATSRRLALAALTVAGALALAPPAVELAVARRDARAADDQAAAALAVAAVERGALADRVAALHVAERELAAAEGRLGQGLDGLLASVTRRHELRTQLADVRAELASLQAAATAAEAEAWGAAAAVRALGSCLEQVSEVLNQLAIGDHAGASRAIQRVAPTCDLGAVVA